VDAAAFVVGRAGFPGLRLTVYRKCYTRGSLKAHYFGKIAWQAMIEKWSTRRQVGSRPTSRWTFRSEPPGVTQPDNGLATMGRGHFDLLTSTAGSRNGPGEAPSDPVRV